MIAKTLLAFIAITLIDFGHAEYNVEKYCPLVKDNTKLPSADSCSAYYTCHLSGKAVKGVCRPGTVFSKDDQDCIPETDSNCIYGFSNPCANKDNQFAPSAKGCNWYSWCENGEIKVEATCPPGQIFYAYNSSCINNDGACDINEKDGVQNICDIMPDNVFFGDTTDCSHWYKCQGLSLEKGSCLNSFVFDVKTGYCLKNNGNMCQRTNNVVHTQASGPPKERCTSPNQVAGDLNLCSTYYTCKRSPNNPNVVYDWISHTCVNQYFDVISKRCTSTAVARAYPGCDRCEFKTANKYWANAVDPTCTTYLTCKNGQKVASTPGSCAAVGFYSESRQACIEGTFSLPEYKLNHGACQDYKCDENRVCSLAEDNDNTSPKPETSDKPTSEKPQTSKKPENPENPENPKKPEQNQKA